jgi:hypothetical protein
MDSWVISQISFWYTVHEVRLGGYLPGVAFEFTFGRCNDVLVPSVYYKSSGVGKPER